LVIKGNVIKYGDNVDTDVIIPARYLNTSDPLELAKHCMEDLDQGFASKVKKGDIIVAGKNFGCGSSREHAPLALKASGISCVIAKTFARIFYRNAINIGLPILECQEAVDDASEGDEISINLSDGKITNISKNKTYETVSIPDFMQEIIQAGGLIEKLKTSKVMKNGEWEIKL